MLVECQTTIQSEIHNKGHRRSPKEGPRFQKGDTVFRKGARFQRGGTCIPKMGPSFFFLEGTYFFGILFCRRFFLGQGPPFGKSG